MSPPRGVDSSLTLEGKRRVNGSREVGGHAQGIQPKRERQYEHIKESVKKRGESTGRAEEIAARTVNKERARSGEARRQPHLH